MASGPAVRLTVSAVAGEEIEAVADAVADAAGAAPAGGYG